MKKFFRKIALLLLPFVVWVLVEALYLPVDYFAVRSWEALEVKYFHMLLPGPFYPNVHLQKREVGAAAYRSKYAVPKDVVWKTDEYGFRYSGDASSFPVVLIGDSNVAGCSLTQSDIMSVQLESLLNVPVYPYAYSTVDQFLVDERFRSPSPEVAVVMFGELRLPRLDPLRFPAWHTLSPDSPMIPLLVRTDRMLKKGWLHSWRSKLRDDQRLVRMEERRSRLDPKRVLLTGSKAHQSIDAALFEQLVYVLKSYHSAFNGRDIRMLFLPIPASENVYWDHLSANTRPPFLSELIERMRLENIPTLDTVSALSELRASGTETHHLDDGHLTPAGTLALTRLLGSFIQDDGWLSQEDEAEPASKPSEEQLSG